MTDPRPALRALLEAREAVDALDGLLGDSDLAGWQADPIRLYATYYWCIAAGNPADRFCRHLPLPKGSTPWSAWIDGRHVLAHEPPSDVPASRVWPLLKRRGDLRVAIDQLL